MLLDIVVSSRSSTKSIKGKHDPGNDGNPVRCKAKSGLNIHLLKMFFDEGKHQPPRRLASRGALVTASNRAFLDEDVADAEGRTPAWLKSVKSSDSSILRYKRMNMYKHDILP